MLRIAPFPALRPQPNLAARVASVPYDVVSTDEARALAADNPLSFLHVVRPEIDLPADTDPHADAVYAQGRSALERLIEQRILLRDETPGLYLYRQVMSHRAQIGLVACCHVDDYERDIIKKHERTRRDKEDDRTKHVLTLAANTGPVLMTYRDRPEIDALVERDVNHRPLFHFNAPDGVTHTVWRVDDPAAYVRAFGNVPCAYVADGHHRSASAARAGAELRAAHPDAPDDAAHNWFLSVLFPAGQLRILPYNRLVRDPQQRDAATLEAALRDLGVLAPVATPGPSASDAPGTFDVLLRDGGWRRLTLDPATIDTADPVDRLDVALLQDRVLEPVFGIGDPRTDPHLDFVGGIRGTSALEAAVAAGRADMAVAVRPTSIDDLMDVADAGRIMPPKSTWFEPKLRSGLFVHRLEPVSLAVAR